MSLANAKGTGRATIQTLRTSEFRETYSLGLRMTCRFFAAFCLHRQEIGEKPVRVGFTVPRALGGAVVRNRIKRRMREAVRFELSGLPANWNVVFNPRRTVLDAAFEDLCRETARVFHRCNERS